MGQELVLIAEVYVEGTVVPWSTPQSFLGGKPGGKRWHVHRKGKRLCQWQDTVRAAVDAALPGREPYLGPAMVTFTFFKAHPDPAVWGKRWWAAKPSPGGDLTNETKAAEDALTNRRYYAGKGKGKKLVMWPGILGDDAQVCDSFLRKRYGERDGALVRVYAVRPEKGPIPTGDLDGNPEGVD